MLAFYFIFSLRICGSSPFLSNISVALFKTGHFSEPILKQKVTLLRCYYEIEFGYVLAGKARHYPSRDWHIYGFFLNPQQVSLFELSKGPPTKRDATLSF